MASDKIRNQIIDATLALAAERPFSEIGLGEIAARAGVGLDTLRSAFRMRIEIVSAFVERVDRAAFAATGETTEESSRERVFDVLMRRFDALAPYRTGARSIVAAARTDLMLALALNGMGVRSMGWMLEAADAGRTGLRGALRAQGLALIWARAFGVWLEGEAPDLDKTMAALDRGLTQGEQAVYFVDRVADCAKAPMRNRRAGPPKEEAAAGP
jgi:AcrR family transcriptional regulator